jgi:hypothetical protein
MSRSVRTERSLAIYAEIVIRCNACVRDACACGRERLENFKILLILYCILLAKIRAGGLRDKVADFVPGGNTDSRVLRVAIQAKLICM